MSSPLDRMTSMELRAEVERLRAAARAGLLPCGHPRGALVGGACCACAERVACVEHMRGAALVLAAQDDPPPAWRALHDEADRIERGEHRG